MDAIIRPEKADAGHNADSGRLREVVVLSKKVYIFLADGFEDIEGLTVVDLLRRAQIDIKTVSIKDTKEVQTAHGISLLTDLLFDEVDFTDADMLVLPGGMPGTKYLAGLQTADDLLTDFNNKGKENRSDLCSTQCFLRTWFPERTQRQLLIRHLWKLSPETAQ